MAYRMIANAAKNSGIRVMGHASKARSLSASSAKQEEGPILNTATLAAIGIVGAISTQVFNSFLDAREGTEHYPITEARIVETEDELRQVRKQRFDDAVMGAVKEAAIWGTASATFLFGLRAIEKQAFRSTALHSMGAPRLVYFITGMAVIGFAIKGEQDLTRIAREPLKVKEKETDV